MAVCSASEVNKYLPSEILIDVLCRLPVKSIVRCRSVCKTWHHIIGTSSFVNYHLTYQKTSPNTNKYILYDQNKSYSLLSDSDDSINFYGPYFSTLKYTPQLFGRDDTYVSRGLGRLMIFGMCNGLLCLSEYGYLPKIPIHLWNPIARKAKKLPDLRFPYKGCLTSTAGLSFAFLDDDYKVIVIAPYDHLYFVSVYSLTTDSWKIIRTNLHFKTLSGFAPEKPTRFVHGTAYMATCNQKIVCFNLGDETISEIAIPKEFIYACVQFRVEAYGESIAVLGCNSRQLSMWVLTDKSSSSSSPWEKKLVIELPQVGLSIMQGFLSNGKYLLRTTLYREHVINFFLCDLETRKITEFGSHHGPYLNCAGVVYSDYVESLLLLNENSLNPFVDMEIESEAASSSSTLSASFILYTKIKEAGENQINL